MTNNDILRRIRYSFDLGDSKVMSVFEQAGRTTTRDEVCDWLKKEDDPAYQKCPDQIFAIFLNGFIVHRRGKKEGAAPPAEKTLNNNLIFLKLKIALNLRAEEVLDILKLGGTEISKHELSALFRKPGHKHYRECKDQILRNFLNGMQIKYRTAKDSAEKSGFSWQ